MDNNRRGSRKAILLVFTVFILGIALGAAGTYVVTSRVQAARPQSNRTPRALEALTRDLSLNADQQMQIEGILSDTRAGYDAIRKQMEPEYDEVRQRGRQRIRQILTPQQGPKFEETLHRMDEERRQRQRAEGR